MNDQGKEPTQEAQAQAQAQAPANARSSVQNETLNDLRRRKKHVDIYLMSGIRLDGMIDAFDQYVITLRSTRGASKQMVYKHAISTVCVHTNERKGSGTTRTTDGDSR